MSNNNFNINERGSLYRRDSLGPIVQEIYTDILGGECLCGASGGIMDGGCTCGSAGGNDEIDGGAEFDLNVGYFGGDVDNLSDDECSDTSSGSSSDTSSGSSSDCSSSDDEDIVNVGGGFDGDFGGCEFDAIVGTYLGGSYISASDLEIDGGEKSFFGAALDSKIGATSPKIETTTSESTELPKRSFSPDPETSRPASPVGSVSHPASPVGSNASGTFMDRRGNKKSQSPTNSPLITTDVEASTNDFGIVLSGVQETPEEISITEQSDLIEDTTNETDEPVTEQSDLIEDTANETDKPVTEQSDLIEDTANETDKLVTEKPKSDDEKPKKTGGRLDNVDVGAMNDALTEFLGKVGSI
jgi:hypothetical protein